MPSGARKSLRPVLDKEISQYLCSPDQHAFSVGVMGDERTYDYAVALRAVTTTDFMTAESAEMPWECSWAPYNQQHRQ